MSNEDIVHKLKYILIEISKSKVNESDIIDLLEHSSFKFEAHWNSQNFPNAFNLELKVTPDIYTKKYSLLKNYEQIIKLRIIDSSNLLIHKLKILPDYDKLQIIESKVFSVVTKWSEINSLQQKLIESLQRSNNSVDFQAIGLVSRTIMDKLSRQVFDIERHKPKDERIKVENGKFKNQLHSYIDAILSGDTNTEFRKLAKSSIDFVEDSVDLMNVTTHKLNAERHLAEVCVISTISAISIIKLIDQIE